MIATQWVCAGTLLLAIAAAPARLVAQQTEADIEGGRQLFQGMCVHCHGAGGAGGDAPSLNRARLHHAPDDAALANVIANGIPNTSMPRWPFAENELRQLVGYVRSLGKVAQVRVPGDPRKGSDIYKNLACSSCHIIGGKGGNFGPDLTDIGFMRGASYLRQALLDPGAALPKDTLLVLPRGYAEFLPVRIATRQGDEIQGVRVNEDAFTIQVRDAAGKISSLRKRDVTRLDKQTGKSLMPSFANRLTASELTDLVAYLSSLSLRSAT
jgi:putative heme-binding domain-containing protein